MKLGMALPYTEPDGSAPTAAHLAARAKLIEDIGFDVIAQGDHVGSSRRATPDVFTWFAIAASATQRVELASSVIQAPLRQPGELAHRLINLNAVSGGRLVAGLGAGSSKPDYDTVDVDFESRFKALRRALPMIRQLCDGEQVGPAVFHPWKNQPPGPPILIGAWASGRWVAKAAREYDGWMASGHSPLAEIAHGIKVFRDNGGKRAMLMSVTVDLHKREALRDDAPFSLECEPAEAADRLHQVHELGFDDVCLVNYTHTEATITADDLREIRALVPPRHSERSEESVPAPGRTDPSPSAQDDRRRAS